LIFHVAISRNWIFLEKGFGIGFDVTNGFENVELVGQIESACGHEIRRDEKKSCELTRMIGGNVGVLKLYADLYAVRLSADLDRKK